MASREDGKLVARWLGGQPRAGMLYAGVPSHGAETARRVLAKCGLRVAEVGGQRFLIPVDDERLSPLLAAANSGDAAAALALLDRLRDGGHEPCAVLVAWADRVRGADVEERLIAQAPAVAARLLELLPEETAGELTALAAEIRCEYDLCLAAVGTALGHARRVGELLIRAKEKVPHGSWLPWLGNNTPVTPRTAQHWMRIARDWKTLCERAKANAKHVSHLPLREALDLLADPAARPWEVDDDSEELPVPGDGAVADPVVGQYVQLLDEARHREQSYEERRSEARAEFDDAQERRSRAFQEEQERAHQERLAQRDAQFDLGEAEDHLFDTLQLVREGWPDGRRAQFTEVARRALARLDSVGD